MWPEFLGAFTGGSAWILFLEILHCVCLRSVFLLGARHSAEKATEVPAFGELKLTQN